MITPHIRWIIRRDMDEMLAIESACFQWDAWREEDFVKMLLQRDVIGVVAEHDEAVVGYLVYRLSKKGITIENLAVDPALWKMGVGRALIEKQQRKLSATRRTWLRSHVLDSNLNAQLFFKAMGFRATGISANHYDDGSDAYKMVYRHQVREETCEPLSSS